MNSDESDASFVLNPQWYEYCDEAQATASRYFFFVVLLFIFFFFFFASFSSVSFSSLVSFFSSVSLPHKYWWALSNSCEHVAQAIWTQWSSSSTGLANHLGRLGSTMCPGHPLRYQKQDEEANIFKVNLWNCPLWTGYFQRVLCNKLLIGFSDPRQTGAWIWLLRRSCSHRLDLNSLKESLLFCSMVVEVVAHFTEAVILKPNNNSRQNNLLADFVWKSYSCKTFCVYLFGVGPTSNLSWSSSLLWTCHCGSILSDVEMSGLWLNSTLSSQNISRIHKCFRVGRHRLRDMRRCSQSGIPAAWVSSQEASEQQQEAQSHMGIHPPLFCSSESTHDGPESEPLRLPFVWFSLQCHHCNIAKSGFVFCNPRGILEGNILLISRVFLMQYFWFLVPGLLPCLMQPSVRGQCVCVCLEEGWGDGGVTCAKKVSSYSVDSVCVLDSHWQIVIILLVLAKKWHQSK